MAEGELEKAPTDGIEIPSPPSEPVPILTDGEITALLEACAVGRGRPGVFDRAVFLGRRDEVVLRLLFDTGVRVYGRTPGGPLAATEAPDRQRRRWASVPRT